ncbi:MAG: hypothetical protein M3N29_07335 [Chloroflexota bacterium]|nr:hypothetical protein [Chloroflexota bacterium]
MNIEVQLSRRRFVKQSLLVGGGLVIAACTPLRALQTATPRPTTTARGTPSVTSPVPTPDSAATVLVRDVLDFDLRGPFAWNGGSVTMRLHEGRIDGEPIYYVRTDASDQGFAEQEGLLFVPLLRLARNREGALGTIYLFENGASAQVAVLSTGPGRDDFTPLCRIVRARFKADPVLLQSAHDVLAAARAGTVHLEETETVVNYPIVKWPGGELPVDTVVEQPLAGGPLLAAPDVDAMTVTFKLHQCYPESRYIVTDTSAVPMAPMMNIEGSPGTEGLAEAHATSKITVFGNGIPGPGAMGFQPGIFERKAGDPAWSPIWDHWTALWKDPGQARLLEDQGQLDAAVEAAEIILHRGTPDTGGRGFVVNCPSPIVAPNDFEVTSA